MKKKKTFGLFGTNKRKTAKKVDKYTEEYDDAYDEEDYDDMTDSDDDGAYYADGEYEDEFYEDDAEYDEENELYEVEEYAEEEAEYEANEYVEEEAEYEANEYAEEEAEYEASEYAEEAEYEANEYAEEEAEYEASEYAEDDELYEASEYAEDDELYEANEYAEDDELYEAEEYAGDAVEEYAEEDVEYDAEEFAERTESYDEDEYAEDDGLYETDGYEEDYAMYSDEYTDAGAEDNYEYGDSEQEICAPNGEQEEFYEESEYESEYYDDEMYLYEEYDNTEDASAQEYDSDEEYSDDEAYEIGYAGIDGQKHNPQTHFEGKGNFADKIKEWLHNMTAFDAILAGTGVVLVVAAVVAFSMLLQSHQIDEQIQAIVPVGTELSGVGVVGQSGLLAMADAKLTGKMSSEIEAEEVVYSTETAKEEAAKVSVSFVSLERDLKIRFTNAETGELITGTAFEVVLTNSKGKQLVLKDDDMDGIIYADKINPGKFDAIIKSTDKYKFPETAQQVTVKDKVEYVVINVQDEVKTEAQVNVAAEDTQKADAVKEEVKLTDTVEWVESSKTLLSGTESYLLIDKTTIQDPSQSSGLGRNTLLFDTLNVSLNKNSMTLTVGSSDTLTGTSFQDSKEGENEYKYTTEWKSSNEGVATVDGGKVTAKAAGTATITYTVTKKTITTKNVDSSTEDVTISIEEYDALSEEEKGKCTPNKNDDGQITNYTYQKATGPKKETTETTETVSASCDVKVEDVKISSASLELTKTADACNVGQTLTVKPSKLVYNKTNGTSETKQDNFPTVSWSSSDTSIATIDGNGVVTGIKAGKATITGQIKGVTGADGNELAIKATTEVTINASAALSVKLDKTEAKLAVGKTMTLTATVTNFKANQGITWESSDKKVATVDVTGLVTGVAPGSVKITATTIEKDTASGKPVTATCVVTVGSNAASDTTTKLKDKNGNQVYVKGSDGNYREAVYADYFTISEFYVKTEGQYAYTGWQTINGRTYYYDKSGKPVTGAQIIQGVTYNFGNDGAIQTTVNGSTFGIDVSRHNGKIDWNAVKSSGVDYVIIRCGYRGSSSGALITDQNFHSNIQGATAAGLKVGIYVFSQAINEVEAVKEASLAVSLAKGYNLTYPIFIDTESSGGRADKIDVATRTAVINAFCQTVQSAGYSAGIYASKTWYEQKLNMGAIGNYKIWLAQYAAAPTYGGRYDMWQYSSKGTISGINGRVDLNLSYLGY